MYKQFSVNNLSFSKKNGLLNVQACNLAVIRIVQR